MSITLGSYCESVGDVLDQVVALAGLDLGGDAGGDLRLVDVVDDDVHADLLPPRLGELVEPRVVAGHEVAPQQDLQVAGELLGRFGERLAGCLGWGRRPDRPARSPPRWRSR
jgi:hypothetical protein